MFPYRTNEALINRHSKRRLPIIKGLKILHRPNVGQILRQKTLRSGEEISRHSD